MMRLIFLIALMAGFAASAQTVLTCSSGCPERYYFEGQPCSSGTCARSYAPLPSEFAAGRGMSLAGYEGATVQVCAPPGHTLSGTGTLRIWTWFPWLPNDVSASKPVELSIADADIGAECSYTTNTDGGVVSGVGAGDGGTNLAYRCRCAHWLDWKVGGMSSRRVALQAVNVAISGTAEAGALLEVRIAALRVVQ